jgi:hypothetical protein
MGSRDEKEHMGEEEASARAAAELYSLRENEREENEVDRGMQVRSRGGATARTTFIFTILPTTQET